MKSLRPGMAAAGLLVSMLALTSGAGADATISPSLASRSGPDGTDASLPAVQIDQIQVLGPSTVRVYATVDPNGDPTTVQAHYGTGGVLNLEPPSSTSEPGRSR